MNSRTCTLGRHSAGFFRGGAADRGEVEHVQMSTPIKRIALLDDVSHHLRFQAVVNEMSDSEKKMLTSTLQSVGAQDLLGVQLNRDIERVDYAWVLVYCDV